MEHEGLALSQMLEIVHDDAILHPILEDLTHLAVGDQLIGVEGDVEAEVVVDHHLKSLAGEALTLVVIDRLGREVAGRAEAISVDATSLLQLLEELRRKLLMELLWYVTEGIPESHFFLMLCQSAASVGCTTDAGLKLRVYGQLSTGAERLLKHIVAIH